MGDEQALAKMRRSKEGRGKELRESGEFLLGDLCPVIETQG